MTSTDRGGDPSSVRWVDLDRAAGSATSERRRTWATSNALCEAHARRLQTPPDGRIELLDGNGVVTRLERGIVRVGAKLTASPTEDLRGFHSLDVTFRVHRPAAEAVAALVDADAIEWGPRHHRSRLSIREQRARRGTTRGPVLVDAVLRGRRTGVLDITIAVFDGNEHSCVVQLRRTDRMPWGIRRRRRRMSVTHEAADHLTARILAVDFRPPAPAAL